MQYGAIGGLVIILVIIALYPLDWPEYFNFKSRSRYNEHRKRVNREPGRSVFYASDAEQQCREHYHREHEKIYWLAYIAISAFTFFAAGFAAYYAAGAYNQAKRQADAAEAGNAPVVYRDRLELVHPGGNQSLISFAIRWKNGGRSPAMKTNFLISCAIDQPRAVNDFRQNYSERGRVAIIGPDSSDTTGACSNISIPIKSIVDNTYPRVLIFSRACYQELGKSKWHVTETFLKINSMQITIRGGVDVDVTAVNDNRNCADEDCDDNEKACLGKPAPDEYETK